MIGTLPDDVLLKIFKFFVDSIYLDYTASEEWRMLVHVCQRWRNLAFTFPRHLNLQLLCRPSERSVKKMLDIWPELPIYLHDLGRPSKEARDDVVAALRLNHRVCGIRLEMTSDSTWERLAPLMQQPFPALTHLCIHPYPPMRNVISRSFLGGSASSLRDLLLVGVPFPALTDLLLSATNLVRLWHDSIPPSGYISPQGVVAGLAALIRLESLSLTFYPPQSLLGRAIRIPPPHTRTLLPALTCLRFHGVPEYLEDLVARIDAPLLESMEIELSHKEVLEFPQLAKFVRRADKLSLVDRAEVSLESDRISVTLSQRLLVARVDPKTLILKPACHDLNVRLSELAQSCVSCLPTPSSFECLHIHDLIHNSWQNVTDAQWLELLHPFNTVKDLRLSKTVAPHVAQALRGLPADQVMEVLPALEVVFISRLKVFVIGG